MRRSIVWPLLLATLGACAGDPDAVASSAALEEPPAIERARWIAAPAGCEDADGALAAVAGEPLLGALVDPRGLVVCVDAMALLREERTLQHHVPGGDRPDPTPTPVVLGDREDPTPTPTLAYDPTL